jgi:hypothetical protein
VDVRVFARNLLESSGSEVHDRRELINLLPAKLQERLRMDQWAMAKFILRFENKDITLYQEHNVWLSVIRERLATKNRQIITDFEEEFDFEKHALKKAIGKNPLLFVYADYMRFSHRIEKVSFYNQD